MYPADVTGRGQGRCFGRRRGEQLVGGARARARDAAGGGIAQDRIGHVGRSRRGIPAQVERSNTGDVRRGHRRPADRVGATGVPVRRDVRAGCEQVDARSVVRVRRANVRDRACRRRRIVPGGRHRERGGGAGRARVARIAAVVPSGDRVGDARPDRVVDRLVERAIRRSTEAHVGHRWLHRVGGDPVNARDHLRVAPAAGAAEDTHRHQRDGLGDPVGRAADDPGDMGGVPALVGAGRHARSPDLVDPDGRAAAEVAVTHEDAGVDDVRVHARAVACVRVPAVERQVSLVDPVEAPRRRGVLGGGGVHEAVLGHRRHRGVARQRGRLGCRHPDGEPVQRVLVHIEHLARVTAGESVGDRGDRGTVVGVERDDVLPGDGLGDPADRVVTVGGGFGRAGRRRGADRGARKAYRHRDRDGDAPDAAHPLPSCSVPGRPPCRGNDYRPMVPGHSGCPGPRPDRSGWVAHRAFPLRSSTSPEGTMSKKTTKRKLRSRRNKANHGKRPNAGRR